MASFDWLSAILSLMRRSILLFLFVFSEVGAQQVAAQKVDLIIRGGHVVTLDTAAGRDTAQSVAISGGRIVAIGQDADLQKITAARVIQLKGELVIPGFIEGHGHFLSLGQSKTELNLRETRNWNQIVAMVRAAAREAKPGDWILGGGWHQAKWNEVPKPNVDGFPVDDELTKAAPNNPVWLTHASGHASMLNAAALSAAGINASTLDPAGGKILHNANGSPTGLLNETAQSLLRPAYKAFQEQEDGGRARY